MTSLFLENLGSTETKIILFIFLLPVVLWIIVIVVLTVANLKTGPTKLFGLW